LVTSTLRILLNSWAKKSLWWPSRLMHCGSSLEFVRPWVHHLFTKHTLTSI
jgi:hypothetical protein